MRVVEVDILRGIAIVMMIIFHFGYDLYFLKIYEIAYTNYFWSTLRIGTVSLFLSLVGVSLYLAYHQGIDWVKFRRRTLFLGSVAGLISIATMIAIPDGWIYFGIVHCILFSTLIGVFFVRIPQVALGLGVFILVFYQFGYLQTEMFYEFIKPILGLPHRTQDLVNPLPWFGVVLIGIFVGSQKLFNLTLPRTKITQGLAWMGRYSLRIYLIHQPIILGILIGFVYLFGHQ